MKTETNPTRRSLRAQREAEGTQGDNPVPVVAAINRQLAAFNVPATAIAVAHRDGPLFVQATHKRGVRQAFGADYRPNQYRTPKEMAFTIAAEIADHFEYMDAANTMGAQLATGR